MTISIVLVVFSALVLLLLFWLAKSQYLTPRIAENPAEQIRFVDLDAFRNLIDPDEEEYLRRKLHPKDFRRIHRERLQAAADYIACAAHNAAVLLSLAEAARRSPNPAVAATAEKLIDNAVRLRLYALQAIPRLYIAMFLPVGRLSTVRVADRYEQMTRQVVLLGLRYPTGGISTAL
jgi:hypothetical protein